MYTRIIPAEKSSTGKKIVERNLTREGVIEIMSINPHAIVINQNTGAYASCIWHQGDGAYHLRDAMYRYHLPTRLLRKLFGKKKMWKKIREIISGLYDDLGRFTNIPKKEWKNKIRKMGKKEIYSVLGNFPIGAPYSILFHAMRAKYFPENKAEKEVDITNIHSEEEAIIINYAKKIEEYDDGLNSWTTAIF